MSFGASINPYLLGMSQQQYYEYCKQQAYFNQSTPDYQNVMQRPVTNKQDEEVLLLINEEGE